jgi:hypothetical protein
MKSTKQNDLEEKPPEIELPDANVLSMLAAQNRFNGKEDKPAIAAALALWREAKWRVDHERKLAELTYQEYVAPLKQIRQPKRWPATFTDFLRMVLGGKDEGVQLNRFRRYKLFQLRVANMMKSGRTNDEEIPAGNASEEELHELEKIIASCRGDIYSKNVWNNNVRFYLKWWTMEKQDVKRRAGKARATNAEAKKKQVSS